MIELSSGWKSVTDREQWAARGASFVAKAKATKVVWFPPKPVETGKKAGSTATKVTKKAAKKAGRSAPGRAPGKTAKKTSAKASGAARKATGPLRRKQA